MPATELILDPATVDYSNVIADIEAIREMNPQRYEMEQLTAIVYCDLEQGICAGYKDITDDEFWIKGHMPGKPLMPGVLMCEAAAQLSSFYVAQQKLMGDKMVGFGGIDKVKFRGIVRPGDRLLIVLKKKRVRIGQLLICDFQSFVGNNLICEGEIRGIPLPDSLD